MRISGINGIYIYIYIDIVVIKKTRLTLHIKINSIKVCECDYFQTKRNKASNNYKQLAIILYMSSFHLLKYVPFRYEKSVSQVSISLISATSFLSSVMHIS